MFNNLGLIALLQKGGITVIILAFFSILSLGVTMERLWAFWKFKKELKAFSPQTQKILANDGEALIATAAGLFSWNRKLNPTLTLTLDPLPEGEGIRGEELSLRERE